MERISQREYARRRGVTHTAVQYALRNGWFALVDGKIDPAAADRGWEENTDQSKPRNSVTGDPKHRRAADAPSTPMDLDGSRKSGGGNVTPLDGGNGTGVPTTYSKARAAREVYEAQLSKLKLDEQTGTLVRADEVRVGAFTAARKARDQLIAIPERLASTLAATDDATEIQHMLEDEIERICQEMSGADAERA